MILTRLQRRSLRLPRRKWAQGVFRQKSEQVSYKVECKGYTSTRNRRKKTMAPAFLDDNNSDKEKPDRSGTESKVPAPPRAKNQRR